MYNHRHTAHCQKESITVHYPYHPLKGNTFKVFSIWRHKTEKYFVVLKPNRVKCYIPAWMTELKASQVYVTEKPIISQKALFALKRIIDTSVGFLHHEEKHNHDGEKNESISRKTVATIFNREITESQNTKQDRESGRDSSVKTNYGLLGENSIDVIKARRSGK